MPSKPGGLRYRPTLLIIDGSLAPLLGQLAAGVLCIPGAETLEVCAQMVFSRDRFDVRQPLSQLGKTECGCTRDRGCTAPGPVRNDGSEK